MRQSPLINQLQDLGSYWSKELYYRENLWGSSFSWLGKRHAVTCSSLPVFPIPLRRKLVFTVSYRGPHNLDLSVTTFLTLYYQTLGMSPLFLLRGRHSALLRALTLALLSPMDFPPSLPSHVPFSIKSILGIVFKITFFTIGHSNSAFFTLYIFYSSNFLYIYSLCTQLLTLSTVCGVSFYYTENANEPRHFVSYSLLCLHRLK